MPKNRNTGIEISDINISKVEDALKRTKKGQMLPEIAEGLRKYVWLISEFSDKEMNVLEGERGRQFQEIYTDFFKLFSESRLSKERKAEACSKYYKVMQCYRENPELIQKCMEIENDTIFEAVLQCLYPIRTCVEASFGSKLLSMINPSRPVWDTRVRKNLKMSPIQGTLEERIENAVATYSCLREKYKNFFNKDKAIAKEWIELFDNSPDIKPITVLSNL